jgi:hypothetical protein
VVIRNGVTSGFVPSDRNPAVPSTVPSADTVHGVRRSRRVGTQ